MRSNTLIQQGWKYYKLNELGFVGRGKSKHRPRNAPFLYGGQYPFIQTGDIMSSEFYITTHSQTYNDKGLAQSKMWNEDTLCLTIAGENTGETAILKFKACFPDSIIGFVADKEKADVRFIKYYFDTIKRDLKNISKGATQDNLSLEKLLSFDFLTPPLTYQRKIAAILSAYDELIVNNTRRIQILDEIVQMLYQEWFVNLRFPEHQESKLVTSKLGEIPQQWQIARLCELVDFIRGVEPGSRNYLESPSNDAVPFLRVGDFGNRSAGIFIPSSISNGKLLQKSDIAITLDGTVGLVKIGMKGCYSTGIRKIVIKDERLAWSFVYCLLKSKHIQDIIKAHAKGTTILHAGSAIEEMYFVLPPIHVMQSFDDIASPLINSILQLQATSSNIRRTRDLLLPKLISGEIDVSHFPEPVSD